MSLFTILGPFMMPHLLSNMSHIFQNARAAPAGPHVDTSSSQSVLAGSRQLPCRQGEGDLIGLEQSLTHGWAMSGELLTGAS